MELFGKMELNTYLCRAKKERDGLRHQRYITQTGYRTLPEFAKKETLRIIPQQFQARQHDTVQLTYPNVTAFSVWAQIYCNAVIVMLCPEDNACAVLVQC